MAHKSSAQSWLRAKRTWPELVSNRLLSWRQFSPNGKRFVKEFVTVISGQDVSGPAEESDLSQKSGDGGRVGAESLCFDRKSFTKAGLIA